MSTARRASFGALTATGVALALVITGCSAPASDPSRQRVLQAATSSSASPATPTRSSPGRRPSSRPSTCCRTCTAPDRVRRGPQRGPRPRRVLGRLGRRPHPDLPPAGRRHVRRRQHVRIRRREVLARCDRGRGHQPLCRAALSPPSPRSRPPTRTPSPLTLSAPDAALPANLAVINMAMLSSDDTEEGLNTTPNGTGPFISTTARRASRSRSPRTRTTGETPRCSTPSEFRVIPDESSIVSAMQSGNVQLAVFDDPLVAQTARGERRGRHDPAAELPRAAAERHARRLTDVNVRLAIQCAIRPPGGARHRSPRRGRGHGPITSPAYKSDPDARPCPERDLDKAAEYLKKAGKEDGVTIKTIVSQGEYATSVNEAQN